MTRNSSDGSRTYTGSVATVPNGYGFIDINTVRASDGADHNLGKFDIFVAQTESPAKLEVGLVLSFEVVPNPEKGDNHWRAFNVSEVLVGELMPVSGTLVPGFRTVPGANALVIRPGAMSLSALRKPVSPEDAQLALSNHPLQGIPGDEDAIEIPEDEEQIRQGMVRYLFGLFPQLQSVGITYEVTGYDEEAQDSLITEHLVALREMEMEAQAKELEALYAQFKATRQTLVWIVEQGLLSSGTPISPVILSSIVKLVQSGDTAAAKVEATESVQKCVEWMLERNLLRANTALPMEVLPDMFMACPVWFMDLEGSSRTAAQRSMSDNDPKTSRETQFFCKVFPGSLPWHHTFQMFNRRTRPLTQYRGDQIPMHVLRLIPQASEVFDHVVVMTPYLDIAGNEWRDAEWQRSIDPYLVGFKKDLPFFFILARWTDSGIFPGHTEMVADTLAFLRANKDGLDGFKGDGQPYWGFPGNLRSTTSNLDSKLKRNVDDLLRAAQMGHLFEWLRGEWTLPEHAVASNTPVRGGPTGVSR